MRLLSSLAILLVCAQNMQATHVMGANISYRCLGSNQYEVSLYVFQNCADPQTTASEVIRAVPSCDFTFASYALSLVSVIEVTQASPQDQANSTCNGGFLPGVVRLTYTDTIQLSTVCPELVIFWKKCNRSAAVNIDNSDSPCFYVESIIKSNVGCNSSPQLSSPTVPYVCGDPDINVNLGVFDPDGDALRYSLVAAQRPTSGNFHTDLVYEPGFSPEEPISGMSIDPINGNMTIETNIIGFYVVAILVEELDANAQVKGSMLVDVQFVVSSCSPFPPYMAESGPVLVSSLGADLTQDLGIAVCNGSSFCVEFSFLSDDPADLLTVSANVQEVLPGAVMTATGVNPVVMNLCWTAQGIDADRLLIISVGNDDEPIPTVVSYGLHIINASDDQAVINQDVASLCGLHLVLENPLPYGQWSSDPTVALSLDDSGLTMVDFPTSGSYQMLWNSGCSADTMTVYAYSEPMAFAGLDDLNCQETGYPLEAQELDASSWGQWTASPMNPANAEFEDANSPSTMVTMPVPGDYLFYWQAQNPACQALDSVVIRQSMDQPEIIQEQGLLSILDPDTLYTYQWYLDGELIIGAVEPTYPLTEGAYGDYNVMAIHANGCQSESLPYSYVLSGIDELLNVDLNVWPNPMSASCHISWSDSRSVISELELRDLSGRVLKAQRIIGSMIALGREGLVAGVYMVSLLDEQGRVRAVKRLMVD